MSQTAAPAGGGAIVVQQGGGGGGGAIVVIIIAVVLVLVVAVTVVLAGVLYVWANSLASDQPDAGTRNNFKAEDSSAAISSNTDDTLIKIRWIDANDALNWAFVDIRLEVGDNSYYCSTYTGEACLITQDGSDDGVWETNEFIQLSESGTQICQGVSCTVNIYVQYDGSTVDGTQTVALS
jgi:hypothetical protein